MREMKDSGVEWIGQIPKDWDVVPHKRVMHKVKEICEQYNGEDIISLTMNGVIKRDLAAGGKMPTSFDGYQYVKPNDLLLCLFDIDVTPRCVGVVKDYGVTSPAYSRFIMHDGYYNVYYDYLLRAIDDDKVFVHLSKNLRSSLTESDFGAIKTCVPSLAEQHRIATFLDAECAEIDAVLEKTRASIEEYKKLKQAVITQAVTKGVRGDRPMKNSGIEWIGEIPKEWKRTKIKMVASFFNGDRTSRYPQPADFVDNGVAFLTSRNIDGDEVNLSETKYITENKYRSLSGAKIQIDDIVFCLRGSVGKCALNRALSCGTVASSLATIRPKNIYPKYLLYFLLSNIASTQTAIFMNGTCAANLSAENVANYYIVLPRSAEQKEIADYLDNKCEKINALIAKKQQYLTEIENYKKSLIYEYVTGKKEVV